MGAEKSRKKEKRGVPFAVVTVSNRAAEGRDAAIVEMMSNAGHKLVLAQTVRDEIPEIQRALREMIEDDRVQMVIMKGGTGISRQAVTLEAVAHFEEKSLPGFGELFRMLSYSNIGSGAISLRTNAFISERKVIFCLPDSRKAVKLAIEKIIAPEAERLVREANR